MFEPSWRLGRIAGIEIRVDPSWTVIALLVAYSLFLRFTLTYRALSGPAGAALAVVATALFFGSVLAHEMTRLVRDAMFSLEKLDVVRPWSVAGHGVARSSQLVRGIRGQDDPRHGAAAVSRGGRFRVRPCEARRPCRRGVRIENTGTRTQTFMLDRVEVAVVGPGESRVVSIDLQPGRYAFSSREDPSIAGTLVVT